MRSWPHCSATLSRQRPASPPPTRCRRKRGTAPRVRTQTEISPADTRENEMTNTDVAGALNLVSPSDGARAIFAAFDAKDVSTLAAHMTDDVRMRLGNAET